jgi:hypothetical protein
MRDRYDGLRGKENANANSRQARLEAEHSSKQAFVKKVQNEQARYAGEAPDLKPVAQKFNAYMCNNGQHAQEFARDLTKGLDKTAFPVK